GQANGSAHIQHCYSAGEVSGTHDVGGFTGYSGDDYIEDYTACFWDARQKKHTLMPGGILMVSQ
ncbi:MAG: hypothetical protein ACYTEU_10305, partial [Planctomycetota bacterium]